MGLTMYIKFHRAHSPNYEPRHTIQVKISGDSLALILGQAKHLAEDLSKRYGYLIIFELFPGDTEGIPPTT